MMEELFYTYNQDTNQLEQAAAVIDVVKDGVQCVIAHGTADDYALLDPPAYPLKDTPPPPAPEGKLAVLDRYALEDGKWTQVWKFEDIPLPTLGEYDDAMEAYLKAEREERGYTTREPDAYINSSVPRWRRDAEDWTAHRDAVMTYALGLINAVQAGTTPQPTIEEFLAGMPKISWTFDESQIEEEELPLENISGDYTDPGPERPPEPDEEESPEA